MSDASPTGRTVDDDERERDTRSPARGNAPDTNTPAASVPPVAGHSVGQGEHQIPVNPPPEPAGSGYALIGPTKSGKTTLLTAIERACQLPGDDNLDFVFTPNEKTSLLIRNAYRRIAGKEISVGATRDVHDFPFRVGLTCESGRFWSPDIEADMDVVMSDGPGGHLFPVQALDAESESFRRKMVQRVSGAEAIVLCVDATNCDLTLLDSELARLFAETTTVREIEHPIRLKDQMQGRFGNPLRDLKGRLDVSLGKKSRRRSHSPRSLNGNGNGRGANGNGTRVRQQQFLAADRFLLLLTQIDKVCDGFPNEIVPLDVANMIDPIAQARHLLGPFFLNRIFKAISPNGQVAVGICSAMGFHPDTGTPFANRVGTPFSWSSELGNEVLRSWTPFGVRDALYFMATGNCRGTVRELTKDMLMMPNGTSEIGPQKGSWRKR